MREMSFFTLSIFTIIFALCSSCEKEKLTPIYNPMTVNELRKDRPLYFSYPIDETQIDQYAKGIGHIPLIGRIFQAFAIILADVKISTQGGQNIDVDPFEVDLSALSDVDPELIKWVKLKKVNIEVKNGSRYGSLTFLKKIEIYAKFSNIPEGLVAEDDGYVKILYFENGIHLFGCDGSCLTLEQVNIDWKKVLFENSKILIRPKVKIYGVPIKTLKLSGSIDFSTKVDVGF
jgi:hypothetical protein